MKVLGSNMCACIAHSLYGETKTGFRIEPLHLHRFLQTKIFRSIKLNESEQFIEERKIKNLHLI